MPPKAKPKQRTADANKREVWELRAKLWNQPVNEFTAFLTAVGAEKAMVHGSTAIKLCCPFHPDSNPSAFINLSDGFFKCYSGSCGKYTKDPLQVVKALDKSTYEHALELYRAHFAGTIAKLRREDVKLLGVVDDEQRRMRMLSEACHIYACNIWLSTALPESAKSTRDWLKITRRIADIAVISGVGMLPRDADLERILMAAGATREDIHAIKSFIGAYLTSAYMDCVVYTYAESPDRVTGFKFRPPGDKKDSIRFLKVEDGDDAPPGVFGLNMSSYLPLFSHDKIDSFTVVEGEHDQLALYQEQLKTGVVDHIYIAAGGGGHAGLDCMQALGLTRGNIVGDDDDAGREWAEGLIKKSPKIGFKVFKYPTSLKALNGEKTDPDDAIKRLGAVLVFQEFNNAKNYDYAHEWCFARAKTKLARVDAEDVVRQLDIASEYGSSLRTEAEQRAYAEAIAKAYPKLQSSDILQQIVKVDDSPLSFINRIVTAIKRSFTPSHHDRDENKLYLWDNTSREHIGLNLSHPPKALSLFQTRIGGIYYNWIKDEVGIPPYFPDVNDPAAGAQSLKICEQRAEDACTQAFSVIASEVTGRWQNLDQGIHTATVETEGVGYIVTGNKQYKLIYKDMDLHKIERLVAPVDGNKVFITKHHAGLLYTDPETGWLEYDSIKAMRAKPRYSPLETLERVTTILNDVFSFKYPEIDALYCALMAVYPTVFDCMNKKVMTHVLGEWESGKSSLMCLLAHNQQIRGYHLVTSAVTTDNYTQAALFQLYGEKRVMVALDEFNDKDDGSRDSVARQQILISLRGLATKGQAERVLGAKEGEGKLQRLNNPFWLLGNTIFNDPMDLSRFNRIELLKRVGKPNIGAALSKYGILQFEELRHALFYHGVHLIRHIHKAYAELYLLGQKQQDLTLSRSIENLIPLGAIYSAFGGDGTKFIKLFHAEKKELDAEKEERSPSEMLFNAVMYSPHIEVEIDQKPNRRSLANLISRADWRDLINTSDRGVFFDKKTNYLAVVWAQAASCLLTGHYSRVGAPSLRTLATQSKRYIPYKNAKNAGAVTRLKVHGMTGEEQHVSFFDLTSYIDGVEKAHEELRLVEAAEMQTAKAAKLAAAAPGKAPEKDPLNGSGVG
jgi:hypothetical protein